MMCRTVIIRLVPLAVVVLIIASNSRSEQRSDPQDSGQPTRGVLAGPKPELDRGSKGPRHFGGERAGRRGRRGRDHQRGKRLLELLMDQESLTAEQRAQIEKNLGQPIESIKAWWDENGDKIKTLRQQMRQARRSGDRDQAKVLGQQYRELWESAGVNPRSLAEQVEAVLTDEQKEQLGHKKQNRRHKDADGKSRDRHSGRRGENAGGRLRRLIDHLEGLSEEQKKQIDQIRESSAQRMAQWHEENGEAMRSLREQMAQAREDGDREKMHQLMEQRHELYRGSGGGPRQLLEKIKGVLNDEQQAQLERQVQKMRRKHGHRRKRGEHHRGQRGDDRSREGVSKDRDARRRQPQQPDQVDL